MATLIIIGVGIGLITSGATLINKAGTSYPQFISGVIIVIFGAVTLGFGLMT